MADSPISALPDVDTLGGVAGTEFLPFARGSLNGKMTPQQLWAWIDETYGPFASSVSLVNVTPETRPAVAAGPDDEFETGATIDLTGSRHDTATPWAWHNQDVSSAQIHNGALVLAIPASSSYAQRAVLQPLAAISSQYRCKMLDLVADASDHAYGGILFYDSTSGKMLSLHVHAATAGWTLEAAQWADDITAPTVVFTQDFSAVVGRVAHAPLWLEAQTDGTNLIFRISASGVEGTFTLAWQETIAAFMGAVTHVGLFANGNNSVAVSSVYDLFRQIS